MTDYSPAKILVTLLCSIVAGLVIRGLVISGPLIAVAQEGSEQGSNSTTSVRVSSETNEASRESRLRSIEEELLKKLNMDDTSHSEEVLSGASLQSEHTPATNDHPDTTTKSAAPRKAHNPAGDSFARPVPSMNRQPRRVIHAPIESAPRRSRKTNPPWDRSHSTADARDLEYRLAIAESQVALLSKEVETAKAALMKSEARVAELSNPSSARKSPLAPQIAGNDSVGGDSYAFNSPGGVVSTSPSPTVPNARVMRSRSPLRTGPSVRESPIARVERDSIVTIERRDGSWYRIISPDGTRGWISGASLIFDEGNFPGSTVNVIGYQPGREPTGIRY